MTKEERKAYMKVYGVARYAANKASIDAKNRAYAIANKEKISEYQKVYQQNNKESIAKSAKKYLENNKEARKKTVAKYYANNIDKIKSFGKKYRTENPEKVRLAISNWNEKNKNKLRLTRAKYRIEHKEERRSYKHTRRARIKSIGGSHTVIEINNLLKLQKYKCAVCSISVKNKYHIDHVMPIALGGSNYISNIQILCPTCNCSKGAKDPTDFMQSRGFLF